QVDHECGVFGFAKGREAPDIREKNGDILAFASESDVLGFFKGGGDAASDKERNGAAEERAFLLSGGIAVNDGGEHGQRPTDEELERREDHAGAKQKMGADENSDRDDAEPSGRAAEGQPDT